MPYLQMFNQFFARNWIGTSYQYAKAPFICKHDRYLQTRYTILLPQIYFINGFQTDELPLRYLNTP